MKERKREKKKKFKDDLKAMITAPSKEEKKEKEVGKDEAVKSSNDDFKNMLFGS